MTTNLRLYPWFQFFRNLLFWQAIWFLYFQKELSAAEAILLAAIYDVATTILEVPSGYMSDRLGRRKTLILSAIAGITGTLLLAAGGTFLIFALGQICLGISSAFVSGTDTALLYETLKRKGRDHEIETHELRAWRYNFTGLAVSALTGGIIAAYAPVWAFIATAVAAIIAAGITLRFVEPGHAQEPDGPTEDLKAYAAALTTSLRHPTLAWLFALAVGMYALSHVPFVFGQPFIFDALKDANVSLDAAIVSGTVTAIMMLLSVATSWAAPALKARIGVSGMLLTALGMQIGLIGILALTNHPIAIALLMLRMVPNSLARPFMLARIHPLLADRQRATYLSIQSLCGRLVFAASLLLSSSLASGPGTLAYAEMQVILICYAAIGLALFAGLVHWSGRARLDAESAAAGAAKPQ